MSDLRRSKIANRRKQSPVFLICVSIAIIVVMIIISIRSCSGKPNDALLDTSSAAAVIETLTSSESAETSSVYSELDVETSSIQINTSTSSKPQISSVTTSVSSASSVISRVEPSSSSSKISSVSSVVSAASSETSSKENIKANVPNGDWRLVIANKKYPLPESYKINTSYIGNYRLDSRIVEDYKKMISAARNDGIVLNLISGFRTYEGQERLFNNKVNQYRNAGYSYEKAKELAAQYVAPPGTSEHLTGLAVDLISSNWYSYNKDLNSGFEKTKEFEWLYNNCAKYGFCLRYPKDKVSITGYSYEPWHYRYVGVEAATEIMNKKICLEEYIATLN